MWANWGHDDWLWNQQRALNTSKAAPKHNSCNTNCLGGAQLRFRHRTRRPILPITYHTGDMMDVVRCLLAKTTQSILHRPVTKWTVDSSFKINENVTAWAIACRFLAAIKTKHLCHLRVRRYIWSRSSLWEWIMMAFVLVIGQSPLSFRHIQNIIQPWYFLIGPGVRKIATCLWIGWRARQWRLPPIACSCSSNGKWDTTSGSTPPLQDIWGDDGNENKQTNMIRVERTLGVACSVDQLE